jgi:hypothetical protein
VFKFVSLANVPVPEDVQFAVAEPFIVPLKFIGIFEQVD